MHVTSALRHPLAGAHHECRGAVLLVVVIQLGVHTGDRLEVTGEPSHRVRRQHDVEQTPLRKKHLERCFSSIADAGGLLALGRLSADSPSLLMLAAH